MFSGSTNSRAVLKQMLMLLSCCTLVVGPKRSTLQAMLVNLDGEDDMPALQSGSHSPPRTGSADIDDNSMLCIVCVE